MRKSKRRGRKRSERGAGLSSVSALGYAATPMKATFSRLVDVTPPKTTRRPPIRKWKEVLLWEMTWDELQKRYGSNPGFFGE